MKLIEYLERKRFNSLKLVLFFSGLTMVATAVVVFVWEKFLLLPFNALIASHYPTGASDVYLFQQRLEHFIISTVVDVLIVTLLLRIVSRQQHRLAASEKRYRSLFEHASDGIAVFNADDYRLVEANNKFYDIVGSAPKELVGKDIRGLLRADGAGARPDPLPALHDSDAPDEVEMTIMTPGGTAVSAAVSSNRLSAGGERLVIMIVRDLSERRRLEAEKEEIRRQLFQSSKLASVGELSAGVAHEINNPLNGIINFAQLLKDDGVARTDDQRLMIDGIIDEGGRIARIVRDLLTFARRDPHELSRVNIAETINASMSLFGTQLRKDGITVEIDVEENLPPVMADGSRLRQVVVNMISNARHALREKPQGPKTFRTTLRAAAGPGGARVRMEFFDNGGGIRREDLDKVFDPFFTTRRTSGGTGLGLSLSFGIVRDYGGTIRVESKEGGYTRFIVELPAANSREANHERAQSVAGGR